MTGEERSIITYRMQRAYETIEEAKMMLDAEQTAKVASHIGECDNCRTLVQSLQKSLELAEVIWQDNLSKTAETIRAPVLCR